MDADHHGIDVDARRIPGCSYKSLFEHLLCRQRFGSPACSEFRLFAHNAPTGHDPQNPYRHD
jgi:hypothetical protein